MAELNEALEGLTSVTENSESKAKIQFDSYFPGVGIKTVNSYEDLSNISSNFVRATISNTIVQLAGIVDLSGSSEKNIVKDMERLGLVIKYKIGDTGEGSAMVLLAEQDGKPLLCKHVSFLPSSESCRGLSEDIDYNGSHLAQAYNIGSVVAKTGGLYYGLLLLSRNSKISHAAKKGIRSATKEVNKLTTSYNELAEVAASMDHSQTLAIVSADEIATANAVSTNLVAAEESLNSAKTALAAAKNAKSGSMGNAASSIVKGVGGAVNKVASGVVTTGGKALSKVGFEGAEEGAAKMAESLATDSAKMASGTFTVIAVAAIGGYCVYKACEYVPKVYHVYDKENDRVVSFCLMKNGRGLRDIGIDETAESVLVTSTDFWYSKPGQLLDVYPVVPGKNRKGLYGLYSTTSTGWPQSQERVNQLIEKYTKLMKTTSGQ